MVVRYKGHFKTTNINTKKGKNYEYKFEAVNQMSGLRTNVRYYGMEFNNSKGQC